MFCSKQTKDHLGNIYDSVDDMCKTYGISYNVYNVRRHKGWSLEEALTKPLHKTAVQDHKGNEYSSIKKMCYAYGITDDVYRNRFKKGWDLKRILTTPVKQNKNTFVDDRGRQFTNAKDMCRANGIPYYLYNHRKKKGLSLKEIKDTPVKQLGFTDPNGITYKNMAELASAYGLTESKLNILKCRHKWDMNIILQYSDLARQNFNYRFKWNGYTLRYKGCMDGMPYFEAECSICGYKDILTPYQITEHAQTHKESKNNGC